MRSIGSKMTAELQYTVTQMYDRAFVSQCSLMEKME